MKATFSEQLPDPARKIMVMGVGFCNFVSVGATGRINLRRLDGPENTRDHSVLPSTPWGDAQHIADTVAKHFPQEQDTNG